MSFLKKTVIVIIVVLILTSLFLYRRGTSSQKITINDTTIFVELAKSPQEKQKGLSGTRALPEDHGMLFVFEDNSIPSFWMKDMLISLDLIWITDTKIVQIDAKVNPPLTGSPDSQLILYSPPVPIDYVLEVNAGFAEKHGIKMGDIVDSTGIK
ncbi:hypothetical protein A2714_02770 [Candidatus Woesebacteria bacterium RIFCSPHIGHO2_01_FULL_38_9]|uniref:DUF192 domain-containing protein n=2 Tax=Candidatus Woeseibacteriota TaxID=1752722 RepID=A0A1F7Y225_9BACT|nr:MAG: hypothetical protein A2714_02770 [Candidatus Woesebacteria bacterium RIFCSPHIGHO2_01_FULL_38_9]OGM58705.1 MAG: hypothetical protein A3A75_00560 [Candidatus Woesebacteria bacterium RIFCSPLOWO2_01_FULL_39_10]